MVGNTVLVTVWLLVGVLGVVAGLLWLRGVERSPSIERAPRLALRLAVRRAPP